MTKIAILGFGVVGCGVAELIDKNRKRIERIAGEIEIKYILDIRDFPDSPYRDRLTNDFDRILSDGEVDIVVEVMGGSHPAYEYTVAALRAGKSVVTSNKEVVSKYGDEFLRIAEEKGVCYRFEAAVGGGIPIISPMISLISHNEIDEVRGILNGTTNYILTKMFGEGWDFDSALLDAQRRGYAERNPDADVLGIDAARKIAILTALATGRLPDTEDIHTEGITNIRRRDVENATKLGKSIKLVGRCIISEEGTAVAVAPFMLERTSALGSIDGVYNGVEVIGRPVGSLTFRGEGAGAGATASSVVGDITQIILSKRATAQPSFTKSSDGLIAFSDFRARNYIALSGIAAEEITRAFGEVEFISDDGECTFITKEMKESETIAILSGLNGEIKSRIRLI